MSYDILRAGNEPEYIQRALNGCHMTSYGQEMSVRG